MKQEAYEILKNTITEHREQMLSGRQPCLGLLRDFGGRDHPEVTLFADAVEENIPDRLLRSEPVTQQIIDSLADDFATKRLYDRPAARFVVSSWADAMGLFSIEPSILTNSGTAGVTNPDSYPPTDESSQVSERIWYYQDVTNTTIPVLESQLIALCKSGMVHANSLVWSEGMAEWDFFSKYFPPASIPPPLPTVIRMKIGQPPSLSITPQSSPISYTRPIVSKMSWSKILWSFEGRIPRRTYWIASSVWMAILFVVLILAEANPDADGPAVLIFLLFIPFVWSSLALQMKRWHDRNKSGAMVLINMIPYVGAVWCFIECGCLRGTVGDNKYGSDPT